MKERKILILATLFICLSFICQEVNLTGYSIYYQGDSFESGGRVIIVNKISQSNVVIEVEGVKNIISIGEYKNINGVKIEVIDLFFVDEEEARNVDISVSVLDAGTCGDGECKAGETSESCCKDCGCQTNYKCEDNECKSSIPAECKKHEDCDDGNPVTIDLCVDLAPKTCKHYTEPGEEVIQQGGEMEEGLVEQKNIIEQQEEKQGFFSKLINLLKNLF